ncbi:HAMP domain-containing histidine kinase [Candidatus Poribacteria bacterium]|nr:HAMP domain-containing histidine kinase [Candidatus Poribacteria bacterium]
MLKVRYKTTNFLFAYFIIGILVLLLAFVYYTSRIVKRLDESQKAQVPYLADLAAVIPSIKDIQLGTRLDKDFKKIWENSRLSFIITEMQNPNQIIKVRGVDKDIEMKIDKGIPITNGEKQKLSKALERMKRKVENIPIEYGEDRVLVGYIYHGDVNADKIGMMPFVITDLQKNPVGWRIWKDYIRIENANEPQIAQALALVREANTKGRFSAIQINPKFRSGYFFYDVAIHYDLMLMPYIQIASITIFLLIGLFVYQKNKANEQAAIWGGLARETAHQLGTPISSLMGWLEVLENKHSDKDMTNVYTEMQEDLNRLRKVTSRFGKIGTKPKRGLVDIADIIHEVIRYFQKRLPTNVEIFFRPKKMLKVIANEDLLQWVFENLMKNSLDALDKKEGIISLDTSFDPKKNQVVIIYKDNGKGILKKNRKKIFAPGFTTKKHGWGLGLTLVKRIVEDYHEGKIRLVDTSLKGTIFEIRLPAE